jgi:hypothetical protein
MQVWRFWWLLVALPAAAQTYTGTLTPASQRFDSPEPNGSQPPAGYAKGIYYYQLFAVPVNQAGPYTFRATTDFLHGAEGILYQDPGPVADAAVRTGASVTNSLVAIGSAQPNFTLTKQLAVGRYYFAISTNAERVTGSFTLQITGPSPLPVQLVSFGAQARNGQVALTWVTASEWQHAAYTVERSGDNLAWHFVARLAGQGSTPDAHTYTCHDEQPLSGVAYYRLRQTDSDGTSTYSHVVSVQTPTSGWQVFPNPATTHLLLSSPTKTTLTIYNQHGQRCQAIQHPGGEQRVEVAALAAGIYWVIDENTHQASRLVKLAN